MGNIAAGTLNTTTLWTEWSNWKLTPWQSLQSWFPTTKKLTLSDLYNEFSTKWNRSLWQRTLTTIIEWYVQANAYSNTLEARIIPAFVALETLAWAYVVEDQHLVSAAAFDDKKTMNAALRITRLLHELHIPTFLQSMAACAAQHARAMQEMVLT